MYSYRYSTRVLYSYCTNRSGASTAICAIASSENPAKLEEMCGLRFIDDDGSLIGLDAFKVQFGEDFLPAVQQGPPGFHHLMKVSVGSL